ncbi:unnamed protein product [Diplocarpon coronariae]
MINKTILLKKPSLQLDLIKGKAKEVVSIESPAASPLVADNPLKDNNNNKDDDNDNAII